VVLEKLNPGGIFITQSGPAGILSCTEVFTAINCTLKSVFPAVVPYTQHMPVFCDVWGWNMALTDPSQVRIVFLEASVRPFVRWAGRLWRLGSATRNNLCPSKPTTAPITTTPTTHSQPPPHPQLQPHPHPQAQLTPEEMDARIAKRIEGPLRFLDGDTFTGLKQINKHLRGCLAAETCIYTKDSARFIHGKVAAGNAGAGNGSAAAAH